MNLVPPPPIIRRVMDIECYRDYFLVKFREIDGEQRIEFEAFPGQLLDIAGILNVLRGSTVVTFNGNYYDMPMLSAAMRGFDTAQLKQMSDAIILRNLKPWDFEREFNCPRLEWVDHIDLIEIAPGMGSLKIYGGRLHSRKMQDLPIEPSASITPELRPLMRQYCDNDLSTTIDLYRSLIKQIELRERMTREYNLDLRSKSDAQIAESVIKAQLGFRVDKPFIAHGTQFRYKTPSFIQFQTPLLRDILAMIERSAFIVSDKDQAGSEFDTDTGEKIKTGVIMPRELADAKIVIGESVYRMGIGGLHSSESAKYHLSSPDVVISDHDVASYYPAIILRLGMFPQQMGESFLNVYRSIVDRRLAAKRAGDKTTADSLKITINGTFGKLGSKWSTLYAPDLLIQTTITGQLSLLMLIEMFEMAGISVVSANTDGIVVKTPRAALWMRDEIVRHWEHVTGFETEANEYLALFSRDVNNYIAFKTDRSYKAKGAYADPGLQKNPTGTICVDAVVAHLANGTPIEQTIRACRDVRKFVTIRTVKGGGVKGDTYLGKAVRWYYAAGEMGAINYASNGNRVAKSEGARPLMELPDILPDDIDYQWYTREAHSILSDLGIR